MRYTTNENYHNFTIAPAEIKALKGILMFSSCNLVPRKKVYWSLDED